MTDASDANPRVTLTTSMGTIELELFAREAPATVDNFLQYVRDGFYDGLVFHRVIDGFMIQGGGFDKAMQQQPTRDPIANEADNGVKNTFGRVAMARTMDPHSATSQFFINVADNDFLNHQAPSPQGWGYAAFGEVVDGLPVVERIRQVATTTNAGHQDVPADPVVIESARIQTS